MIVAIHQPSYFPWLGLLHKIHKSDSFIILNQVQLSDSSFQHRNLFLANNGVQKFLTIPFNRHLYRERRIEDLEIANQDWSIKHKNFIVNNYSRHPFFAEVYPYVSPFFEVSYESLFAAIFESMKICLQLFEIRTEIKLQSEFYLDDRLRREELVESLIVAADASIYLSGTGATNYLTKTIFKNGAQIKFDRFEHPTYSQRHSKEFISGLSCLDMLFNIGIEQSQSLLRKEVSESL